MLEYRRIHAAQHQPVLFCLCPGCGKEAGILPCLVAVLSPALWVDIFHSCVLLCPYKWAGWRWGGLWDWCPLTAAAEPSSSTDLLALRFSCAIIMVEIQTFFFSSFFVIVLKDWNCAHCKWNFCLRNYCSAFVFLLCFFFSGLSYNIPYSLCALCVDVLEVYFYSPSAARQKGKNPNTSHSLLSEAGILMKTQRR